MNKILTVTVPSYNVEKFLNQTLESFVDIRILDDIEILVVDDGSKDKTVEIGKKYEAEYPDTFRVISKENGGHGSTINCGISEAKGKYFKVIDGDDWVFTKGFVELVDRLKKCNADYVFTNYYEVNDITNEKREICFFGIPENVEIIFDEIAKDIQISMHALVIKTEILREKKIHIDENSFYVDVEYILYPVPYVENIIYFDIYVYMYRIAQMEQSVSMKGFQKHMQNHIDVILHVLDYINENKIRRRIDENKIYYMEKRIAEMVVSQVGIFNSFPLYKKKIRKQFIEFDKQVKEKNMNVYIMSGRYSGMLRTLRKTRFHFYSLISLLSRARNWKV